jgi:glycosyltransferase involved in cell wall biosynthesis
VTKPIRLLELRSAWGAGGGPEKTILLSAARHDRSRVVPTVAYLRSPGDRRFAEGVRAHAQRVGAEILEVCDRTRADPFCVAKLRRLAQKADVIHAHDYKTDVYGLLLRRGAMSSRPGTAKLIATAHGWTGESLKVRAYQRVDTAALRLYDKVLAVSEATRAVLLRAGVSPDRIEVVRNGIDVQAWRPDNGAGDLRAELGLSRDDPIVGTIARLSREKGVDLLIEAAARVDEALRARGEKRATFLVAGDGPEHAGLLERARLRGPARPERFRFLGHRPDALRVLNTLDVFVLPSRTENMPNALLEAMAAGKPCVAFAVGGNPETLGDAGLLAPAADTHALGDLVLQLLRDGSERQALARAARRRVEQEFSFDRRLARVESIYERLVAEPRQTRTWRLRLPWLRRPEERAA